MPQVTFDRIIVGETYSRNALAALWGYAGFEAIARGVVTPAKDNKIILFVTGIKREHDEQYQDALVDGILRWEGPNDHYAEQRMIDSAQSGDEVHLFYREQHNLDFTYHGQLTIQGARRHVDRPSLFTFVLGDSA
jgi:hypothetical protein